MKRKITKLTLLAFAFMVLFMGKASAQTAKAYYFAGPVENGNGGANVVSGLVSNSNGTFDFGQGTIEGTIEGWVKPDFDFGNPCGDDPSKFGDDPVIFSLMDWDGPRWAVRMSKDYWGIGAIGANWTGDWHQYNGANFNKGQWYHIAAVFTTDNKMTVYVNGTSVASITIDVSKTNKPFHIGISNAWDNKNLFKGAIGEVRVWNVARTQSQIQATMNTTVSPSNPDLIAYYKFNEIAAGISPNLPNATGNASLNGNIGAWVSNASAVNNNPIWVNGNSVLPLDFISLKALKGNNNISLNWQTANEVNTSHFNVLHSTNGINWVTVGKVDAKGLATNSYNYQHVSPATGNNYYKLQQVDANGDFTYSDVKIVEFSLSNSIVKIYPNPVSTLLEIQLSSSQLKEKPYYIYNITGTKIMQGVIKGAYHAVDVSKLSKGIYSIQIEGETSVKVIKL